MKMIFSKKKESTNPITHSINTQTNNIDYIKKNTLIANKRMSLQMNIQKSCSSCK